MHVCHIYIHMLCVCAYVYVYVCIYCMYMYMYIREHHYMLMLQAVRARAKHLQQSNTLYPSLRDPACRCSCSLRSHVLAIPWYRYSGHPSQPRPHLPQESGLGAVRTTNMLLPGSSFGIFLEALGDRCTAVGVQAKGIGLIATPGFDRKSVETSCRITTSPLVPGMPCGDRSHTTQWTEPLNGCDGSGADT